MNKVLDDPRIDPRLKAAYGAIPLHELPQVR